MKRIYFVIALVLVVLLAGKSFYIYLAESNGSYTEHSAYFGGDGGQYLKIGKTLSRCGVYSDDFSCIPSETASLRPPLWPVILAIFFLLVKSPFALICMKVLFELIGMLFLFRWVCEKKSLGRFGYLLFPILFVEPHYLKYSITFLSESVAAIILLALGIAFQRFHSNRRGMIFVSLFAVLGLLAHPVSLFFIGALFGFTILFSIKSNVKVAVLNLLIFMVLSSLWPMRNYFTYGKGFFLTSSQGMVFSKAWNEGVKSNFTNVDGDLGNEGLNLQYLDSTTIARVNNGVIERSKVYTMATLRFLKDQPMEEIIQIALCKLKSNFNPFPEKPKKGFIENMGVFFRLIYTLFFLQCILSFLKKGRDAFHGRKGAAVIIGLCVIFGQSCMAVVMYTGLRFNSIYSLLLLYCFFVFNLKEINFILKTLFRKFDFALKSK